MAYVYLECNGYMLVKVIADYADLTGSNRMFFETAKIPPPKDLLLKLSKRNLNKLIAPYHSGYSISSQDKAYLTDYINSNWEAIMMSHVREVNRNREVKLKSAWHFEDDAVINKSENEESDDDDEDDGDDSN